MKIKKSKAICLCAGAAAILICMVFAWNHRYIPIDEWSNALTPESVESVMVSRGYGVEKISYAVPAEEYADVIAVLQTVTEESSTRKYPDAAGDRNDHNMAFFYGGKLWLFQCRETGFVSLTFADGETGARYGCEGKLLYIHSDKLWNYIMDTVNTKAN